MLGIDIGEYSVKAAVLTGGKKKTINNFFYKVISEGSRTGEINDEIQGIVKDIIKKSKQKELVFCVSSSNTIMKTIPLDKKLSGDILEGEVQMAMTNFIPFPLDQVYIDFVENGVSKEDESKKDIFIVAAKKDSIDKLARLAPEKLVKKKEVDIDVFALGQTLELIKGKKYRESYGIIDIGYQTTKLYAFKGSELVFSRVQQIGGQGLTDLISEVYDVENRIAESRKLEGDSTEEFKQAVLIPFYENLAEQIGLAIELYSSSNDPLETIYLCGGGSLSTSILESLNENLPGYRFEHLPLTDSIKVNSSVIKATGLASKEVAILSSIASGLSFGR